MISLQTYNKEQLKKLIDSDQFLSFPFKPISRHRALSHINNPRAAENDTLLILAFEDDKLAGYIGFLPDYFFHNDQKIKVSWLSTLFVHPDFRGKRIAQQLLSEACKQYNDKILITEFTPEAENMYVKSKTFDYVKPLQGFTYHYRFNLSKILPQKKASWQKYTSLLKGIDNVGNLLITPFIGSFFHSKKNYAVGNILDEESLNFINENKNLNSFRRNADELSWIVNYPWILNGNSNDEKYLFSSFAREFKYIFIKVYNEKNILSNLLVLTVRDQGAKLQYIFGNGDNELCAEIIHQYLIKNKLKSLICFDEGINPFLKNKSALYKKERTRKYLMNIKFKNSLSGNLNFEVSGGDADCIFT